MRRLLTGLLLALVMATTAAPAAAATGRTAILYVGGLGSTSQGISNDMALVSLALPSLGYAPGDVRVFSYDPSLDWGYDRSLTCQSIADSEAQLRSTVAALQTQGYGGVVLVGHSLGGVIAFDLLNSPGVRKVITVDAPLGGLGSTRAYIGALRVWLPDGTCPAADGLVSRSITPGWGDHLGALGQNAVAHGVGLLVVANEYDMVVSIASQELPGLAAETWAVQLADGTGLLNHTAALKDWSTAAALAQWIGPQQ